MSTGRVKTYLDSLVSMMATGATIGTVLRGPLWVSLGEQPPQFSCGACDPG